MKTRSVPANAPKSQLESGNRLRRNGLFVFALCFSSFIVVAALAIKSSSGMNPWMYSYYFINYEFEFIRRGLPGEILRLFSVPLSNQSTSLVYAIGFAVCWIFCTAAFVKLFKLWPSHEITLLFLLTTTCPALTLHFALLDFGRFDIFLVALLFASIAASISLQKWTALASVTLLQLIACAIHEGALLITTPMAMLIWVLKHGDGMRSPAAFVSFSVVLAGTVVIWIFGDVTEIGFEDLMALYTDRSTDGKQVSDGAIRVVMIDLQGTTGTLFYSFERTVVHHLVFFAALSFHFAFFWRLARASGTWDRLHLYATVAIILSPLLMYPLGHDFFRWWSFVVLNAFTFILCFSLLSQNFRLSVVRTCSRTHWLIVPAIIVGLALGGTGDKNSFTLGYVPVLKLFEVSR